ncbi:MAG TPA: dienelactone hydrolase family protein [Bryobacteraceae bacterium]|jgi:carboxymethylenebutenolidase
MFSSDLKSLLPEIQPENRREFVMKKLAIGFALAVQPICAQTAIVTDAKGLTAGEVKIPVKDGVIPGYRACPAKGRSFPIVLVVQEIFGVHEHIKDLCRRLAHAGYCAVAPELFSREGDVSKMTDVQQIVNTVVSKVPDADVMSDLDSTANWAAKVSHGDVSRLAITGFCWGGRIAWLYAAHNPKLRAAAAWYGRLEGDHNAMTPKNPLDYAGGLKAPVIGFYGGKDTGIPQESLEKMKTSLSVVKDPSQINVYPNAEHGFNADYRPSYNKEAATDAWQKMLDWFKKNGA